MEQRGRALAPAAPADFGRLPVLVLAAAMPIAFATVLYVSRGGTFFYDDLAWFMYSPQISAGDVFEPHYGHLVAVSRVLYKCVLEAFGSNYIAFRIVLGVVVVASAGVFFAYARRRVGDALAAIPAVLLLFLGAAWYHLVTPQGITIIGSVALGLGALLALDRGDRRGDLAACGLLVLGIGTYTAALPYLAAVAVSVLGSPRRWQRAWVFAVPAGLYAIWFLVSHSSGASSPDEQTDIANLLLAPAWSYDSLSLILGALTGIGYDFGNSFGLVDLTPGRVLSLIALAGLGWHVYRRGASLGLVVALTVPLSYWILGATASGIQGRVPLDPRYVYPGSVGVLLVALEVFRGYRPTRRVVAIVGAIGVLALAMNLALLRDGSNTYRNFYTPPTRAALGGIELTAPRVDPSFDASATAASLNSAWDALTLLGQPPTGAYLGAAEAYGGLGFSPAELAAQPEPERATADAVMAAALGLTVGSSAAPETECRTVPERQGTASAPLPPGGAILRGTPGSAVEVRRFATDTGTEVGTLGPAWSRLEVPADLSDEPWVVSAATPSLELCPVAEGSS